MTGVAFVGPRDGVSAALAERLRGGDPDARVLLGDDPAAARLAAGADTVVFRPRALPGRGPDLAAAAGLLETLAAVRPRRLVLLSSAQVFDPAHEHPGHVGEETRPRGRNPIARRWLELEAMAAAAAAGWGGRLAVLRPATVVARDGADPLARFLLRRRAFPLAGYGPSLQLLAPEDLAAAVGCIVDRDADGVFHVAPRGVVPVREALRLAGARSLPLPGPLLRLFRRADGAELAYLRHPWTVGDRRLRALGWAPERSSAEALLAAAGRDPAGAPAFDDYGMDERYIAAYGRTLFRFLHRAYWRIEVRGLEHVPRRGAAVLTGVHRGFMPWDGVMALHTVARGTGRIIRFLIHPCLVKQPFLANYMTKLGGILACQENGDWVLERGELLGMFPEGIHGAFTPYRRAYRLGKFGRDEYVKMALRHGAPIVPFVTVGSAEIYPIFGRLHGGWVHRLLEWPYFPLGPNFPLPGLPLPSKWHTRFLEPLHVAGRYPPEAADDPEVVHAISQEVRGRLEAAIADMLRRRKHLFWGSIFDTEEAPVAEPASAPGGARP
jgi:1-acyl-sn-glycerol-3-phosphate acyltransferase/nucleoside-diphosphate-sugar epimerase